MNCPSCHRPQGWYWMGTQWSICGERRCQAGCRPGRLVAQLLELEADISTPERELVLGVVQQAFTDLDITTEQKHFGKSLSQLKREALDYLASAEFVEHLWYIRIPVSRVQHCVRVARLDLEQVAERCCWSECRRAA